MGGVWLFLAGGACLATAGILAFGIGGFGTGKMTPQKQNKLMRLRILAQFIAVILILIAVMAAKS